MPSKVRLEDSKAVTASVDRPVEKPRGVQSIPVQDSGRSRFYAEDGNDLRGVRDSSAERSKGTPFPAVKRTGHSHFLSDNRKERKTLHNHNLFQPAASASIDLPTVPARSDTTEKLSISNPAVPSQMQMNTAAPSKDSRENNVLPEPGLVRSIHNPPMVLHATVRSLPSPLPAVGPTSPIQMVLPLAISDTERINSSSIPPTIENVLDQHHNLHFDPPVTSIDLRPLQKSSEMQTPVLDDFCEDSQTQDLQAKPTRLRDSHLDPPLLSKSNKEETMVAITFFPCGIADITFCNSRGWTKTIHLIEPLRRKHIRQWKTKWLFYILFNDLQHRVHMGFTLPLIWSWTVPSRCIVMQ